MIRLRLGDAQRDVLRSLPGQLLELLESGEDSPVLQRLLPRAYSSPDDVALEAEYQRLMGSELRAQHRSALEVMLATVDNDELDDEQAHAWLAALNQIRLALGTLLEVDADTTVWSFAPDDPRRTTYALYGYLSALQEDLVEQLTP